MPDSATTVVAVLVAGVAGPGITAWATSRAQRRRIAHERDLHDRDDLKTSLDAVAETLGVLDRAARDCLNQLSLHGPTGEETLHAVQRAVAEARATRLAISRLSVRVDPDDPVLVHAFAASLLFEKVIDTVAHQVAWRQWSEDYVYDDAVRLCDQGDDEGNGFLGASRVLLARWTGDEPPRWRWRWRWPWRGA